VRNFKISRYFVSLRFHKLTEVNLSSFVRTESHRSPAPQSRDIIGPIINNKITKFSSQNDIVLILRTLEIC